MKIKVIKQGNQLILNEAINLEDGQAIMIDIPDIELNKNQCNVNWEDFKEVIGAWKNNQEITEIYENISQERHEDLGRDIKL